MALSVQMTIVVLDRMKHVFQIDHAPTALAGPVFDHGHHLEVDVAHVPDRSHDEPNLVHDIAFSPDVAHPHDHDVAPHSHDHETAPAHSHDHDALPHSHESQDVAHAHDHDT